MPNNKTEGYKYTIAFEIFHLVITELHTTLMVTSNPVGNCRNTEAPMLIQLRAPTFHPTCHASTWTKMHDMTEVSVMIEAASGIEDAARSDGIPRLHNCLSKDDRSWAERNRWRHPLAGGAAPREGDSRRLGAGRSSAFEWQDGQSPRTLQRTVLEPIVPRLDRGSQGWSSLKGEVRG